MIKMIDSIPDIDTINIEDESTYYHDMEILYSIDYPGFPKLNNWYVENDILYLI